MITLAVANITIIRKMIAELQKAKIHIENDKMMKKHIGNVQLLCELMLEDEKNDDSVDSTSMSAQEVKAMLGDQYDIQNKQEKHKSSFKESKVNHDDANGDSIFDF